MRRGIRGIFISLSVFASIAISFMALAAAVPKSADLKSVVPGSARFERKLMPVDYYEMQDANGRSVGLAFVTSSIPPEVGGYRGELDVLVGMDWKGKITGVKIIGHSDDPEHMEMIIKSGLPGKFTGRIAGDSFADIEAVTGATISSQAIIDDVRLAAKAVFDQIMGRDAAAAGQVHGLLAGVDWPEGLGALAIVALALICVTMPARRWLRYTTMALSVGIVGLWLGSPITIGNIVDVRNYGLPWSYNLPLAILIVFALGAALFRGNLYCCYVCPFGALQEGAAKVLPWKLKPNDRIVRSLSWLRWIVTLLAIYAIAAAGSEAFRGIEPFSMLFMRYPGSVAIVQAGVVLAAALIVRRVWCRFFCPTGLIIDIFAELGCKVRYFVKGRMGRSHAKG